MNNPLKVKKYRDAFEEKYNALQHLTRTRLQLIEQLVRTKQHFIENIYYKCNTLSIELKNHQLSTNIWSATIMALMVEDYTLDELASLPLEKFLELIQKLGRGKFKAPDKLAKAIQATITGSYRLSHVQLFGVTTKSLNMRD